MSITMEVDLKTRDRAPMNLVGSFVEVRWSGTHSLAKRQCEKCVYLVRGAEGGMICLELIYDAIDGVHKKDAIYWVDAQSVQYLRVLTEAVAQHRIDSLEREVLENHPKD